MEDLFDLKKVNFEVKINEKGKMMAQVDLIYGELRVKGYRIMQSKDLTKPYFVQPPSISYGGRFTEIVYIEDRPKWLEFERLMIEEYKKVKAEFIEQTVVSPEDTEIDPDDIPF